MKEQVSALLRKALQELMAKGAIPGCDLESLSVSVPSRKEFGDFSTNIAMVLASQTKRRPREIAEIIQRSMACLLYTSPSPRDP